MEPKGTNGKERGPRDNFEGAAYFAVSLRRKVRSHFKLEFIWRKNITITSKSKTKKNYRVRFNSFEQEKKKPFVWRVVLTKGSMIPELSIIIARVGTRLCRVIFLVPSQGDIKTVFCWILAMS